MKVVSELSDKCQNCPHVNDCDKKRKMACAVAELPEPVIEPSVAESASPLMADILAKHDYRDVKIVPNTTVTIDLEDLKKQMVRDFYRAVGCPGFLQ